MIRARHLRAAALREPRGLHVRTPRLSWIPDDPRPGACQTAWEVVASTDATVLPIGAAEPGVRVAWTWRSGRVDGDEVDVAWGGHHLVSRQRLHWTVRLWDADGRPGPWADPTAFEMGLLAPDDWRATWIAGPPELREPVARPTPVAAVWPDWTTPDGVSAREMVCRPPVRVRHAFRTEAVTSARLYVAVRGLAAVSLNGLRVGDEELAPGWVDHRTRLLYRVHDVTGLLRDGRNAIGITLADGWWSGRVFWRGQTYGTDPSVMVQLELTLADGSVRQVCSDATWECGPAAELWADLMMGEVRDLRLTETGWDEPGGPAGPAGTFRPARTLPPPAQSLVCHPGLRVVVVEELIPRAITHPAPGTVVVDLGQNMVGRVRLRIRGGGDATIVVRHAEALEDDGTLHVANLRTAAAIDAYLLDGSDEVVLEPRFTSHGFRHVEVSGLPPDAELLEVVGVVLTSDVDEVGNFACSNPMVDRLVSNIRWSRRGNTVGLMTDCPQRDERLGWMGDALVFLPTAVWLADLRSLVTTWYDDVLDGRSERGAFQDIAPVVPDAPYLGSSAGWADAGVVAPTTLHRQYGDTDVLAASLDAMLDWVRLVAADNPDGLWLHERGNDYGDWLAVEGETPKELVATAQHAHTLSLVARAADVVGRDADAAWCRTRRAHVVDAFRHAYLTPSGRLVGHTQTAYVLALAYGLVPDHLQEAAAEHLRARIVDDRGFDSTFAPGHVGTGFLGTVHLLHVLAGHGHLELAYRLLEQDTPPSWGAAIANGATTTWERWDGWTPDRGFQTPEMNSFNHTSLGSVGAWLFTTVAGIRVASPGMAHVRIEPRPGGSLTWAEATHDGPRGRIRVRWERHDQTLEVHVTIPCGTTAEIVVPGAEPVTVLAGTHTVVGSLAD